jgi:hypothetical protein
MRTIFTYLLLVSALLSFGGNNILLCDSASVADSVSGGKKKSAKAILTPYHRNVIKLNPTPMLLWTNVRNITLTYERLIAKNHSLSLQLGYLELPKILPDTLISLVAVSQNKSYGLNIALDYRYYPWSRNRRPAPDGLYIGAYFSYYGFNFGNNLDILNTTIDQNGKMEGKISVYNLGMSLGYQFIFWKRFSLDLLLFGPSVSYYTGYLGIEGNLDPSQIQGIDQELVQKILQKFPFLNMLFSNQKLEFTGTRSSLAVGFRYAILLGFHF